MRIIHDPACSTYHRDGHPEHPQRVTRSVVALRASDLDLDWVEPDDVDDTVIAHVHSRRHLERLAAPHDFDADTPYHDGIGERARTSVAGALIASRSACDGTPALSLLRPPGHHALPDRAMGFCYLNQVAIAAVHAARAGLRVAVFDFDVHHGNGTEAILTTEENATFFSIHQYPAYPGTGGESQGNAKNYPMRPGTSRTTYRDAVRQAFDDMTATRPDLVIVSAGFDAYRGDPLSDAPLEGDDYEEFGRMFTSSGLAHCAVLEGGYSDELPELVTAYVRGAITG